MGGAVKSPEVWPRGAVQQSGASMKSLSRIGLVLFVSAAALLFPGCSLFYKPAAPLCQGDPALKPCPCMDPRTPGCPPPPNDWGDNPSTMTTKPHPDGGTDR